MCGLGCCWGLLKHDRQTTKCPGTTSSPVLLLFLWASGSGPHGLSHPGFPVHPLPYQLSHSPNSALQLLSYQFPVAIIGVSFQALKTLSLGQACRVALTTPQIMLIYLVGFMETSTLQDAGA